MAVKITFGPVVEPSLVEYPVCNMCGSKDVTKDAIARWDYAAQDWVVVDTLDDAYCKTCESSTQLEWFK